MRSSNFNFVLHEMQTMYGKVRRGCEGGRSMNSIYKWNEGPNIDLLSDRVVWWNEDEICVKESE